MTRTGLFHARRPDSPPRPPEADASPNPAADDGPHPTCRAHPVRKVVVLAVVAVLVWVGWSLGHALAAPGTDSTAARTAKWARDHHIGLIVGTMENVQYRLHPPRVGGLPDAAALHQLTGPAPVPAVSRVPSGTATPPVASAVPPHRRGGHREPSAGRPLERAPPSWRPLRCTQRCRCKPHQRCRGRGRSAPRSPKPGSRSCRSRRQRRPRDSRRAGPGDRDPPTCPTADPGARNSTCGHDQLPPASWPPH